MTFGLTLTVTVPFIAVAVDVGGIDVGVGETGVALGKAVAVGVEVGVADGVGVGVADGVRVGTEVGVGAPAVWVAKMLAAISVASASSSAWEGAQAARRTLTNRYVVR
jgi:hypothetical protein